MKLETLHMQKYGSVVSDFGCCHRVTKLHMLYGYQTSYSEGTNKLPLWKINQRSRSVRKREDQSRIVTSENLRHTWASFSVSRLFKGRGTNMSVHPP